MKLTLAVLAVFLLAGTATASAPGLTITLHGSGSVQPPGTSALGFPSQGRLTSVDVRVGEHVSRGQALASIDAGAARTALANALSNLASALARGPQLRSAVAQARQALADTKAQIALEESAQQAAVDKAARQLADRQAKRAADQTTLDAAAAAYDAAKQKVSDAQATEDGHQLGRADQSKQQTVHQNQLARDQDAMASPSVIAADKALIADDAERLADYDRALARDGIALAAAQAAASDAKTARDEAKQAVRDDDAALVTDTNALESARQTLATTKLKNRQTLHNAENAVETARLAVPSTPDAIAAARAAVADARLALERTTLRAPVSGTVAEVHGSVGETAAATVVTLVEDGSQEVTASFDEIDASKLRVGMAATVRLPSLDNQTVSARVTAVDPIGTHGKFDVTFALEGLPAGLLAGMTAEVDVTVAVGS